MWDYATKQEAIDVADMLKGFGYVGAQFGSFKPENLLLHKDESDSIDGAIYFVPDSLYTIVAEIWFAKPEIAFAFRKGLRKYCEDHPETYRICIGYTPIEKASWINALVKGGGYIAQFSVQTNFEGRKANA